MSNKGHVSGGKFGGAHTTMITLAETIANAIVKYPFVTKISPGHITSGLSPANGNRQMKVFEILGGVKLSVRGNTSKQDMFVYTEDIPKTKSVLRAMAEEKKIRFRFGMNADK